MLFDWLKTPACKICTNKRNAKRSAIIRLSSNGKASVEFKINWLCQPQNRLIHLLHCSMERTEARQPLCFPALPLPQCNPCLSNAILKIQLNFHSFPDFSSSPCLPTSWHSRKWYQRVEVKSSDCDVRSAINLDPQWPGAPPLWKMRPGWWLWGVKWSHAW